MFSNMYLPFLSHLKCVEHKVQQSLTEEGELASDMLEGKLHELFQMLYDVLAKGEDVADVSIASSAHVGMCLAILFWCQTVHSLVQARNWGDFAAAKLYALLVDMECGPWTQQM